MAERSTTTPVEAAAPERDRLLATKLHVPRPDPATWPARGSWST
jgi:hypothetical protein